MKYAAIDKTGKAIMSYYADSAEDAIRAFEILLRGKPGKLDWYKIWVDNGKQVVTL